MVGIWLLAFLFFFGLCVGSFVNVLVLRFGFGQTPMPRSHCMACDAPILWHDLIPLVSYFVLRGRCRSCGSTFSWHYPAVELTVGILFLLAFFLMPPVLSLWSVLAFAALLMFLTSLLALVVYDLRHTLVPMPFIYALVLSAFLAALSQSFFVGSYLPMGDAFLGGAALFGFFFALVLVTGGRGMGMGDVYVAGAAGLLLGLFRGIEAIMFGVWSATLVYVALFLLSSIRSKKRLLRFLPRVTMKTELPFVPFLAFGIGLALFTNLSPLSLGAWLTNILFLGHS